jgi:hypothetical protein
MSTLAPLSPPDCLQAGYRMTTWLVPSICRFAGTHLPSSMAAAVKAFSGYYAAQNPTRKVGEGEDGAPV